MYRGAVSHQAHKIYICRKDKQKILKSLAYIYAVMVENCMGKKVPIFTKQNIMHRNWFFFLSVLFQSSNPRLTVTASNDLLDKTEAGENTLYTTVNSDPAVDTTDTQHPGYPDKGNATSSIESSSVDETSTMIADDKETLFVPEKFQVSFLIIFCLQLGTF